MTEKMNLKEIEKKAYRFTFQDEIYDIMFGVLLVSFALAPILREVIGLGYILFLVIPAPLILTLGKRYISVPRIGIVKFGLNRQVAHKKLVIISVILVIITLILLMMTITKTFPGTLGTMLDGYAVPLIIGISTIIGMGVFAYIKDFPHLWIYGLIIGLSIPVAEVLYKTIGTPLNGIIAFGVPGIVILIYGSLILFRFLHKYPLPKEEMSNENSG
jgi:hypothetical protein